MKAKLALLIIIIGLVISGIGIWQIINSKMKTNTSLEVAKKLVQNQTAKTAQSNLNNIDTPPKIGDTIGLLAIPKINAELAVVEGTDPDDLEKGVGHYNGSYFPGDNGQIVLSGHRDTVFRRLGELKRGDLLNMQMPYGEYSYEVTHTKIVKANDTSIITLQNQNEELILTTCYPFRYLGKAPERYIIYAKLKRS